MNGAFYIAATGLRSEQSALDVIANNIANINTTGFKRSQVSFSELVASQDPSQSTGGAGDVLSGVSVDTSHRIFTQGDLRQTGKSTDVAISGGGFIELLGGSGRINLWRGGGLTINADGYLAADNGMPLKAMISVPSGATAITISGDGDVQAIAPGSLEPKSLGHIDLVVPKDVTDLRPIGGGLYEAANDADLITATPGEDDSGLLVQGSLEGSNVQLADEMVTLLLIQRAYAANAQVVQAGDQLMNIANGLKR